MSEAGIPLSRRGAVGVDTASFTYGSGEFSGVATSLFTSMPVQRDTFFDVRLPIGLTIARQRLDDRTLASLGNIMLGGHHVLRAGRRVWISFGGALGLPTLSSEGQNQDNYEAPTAARAYWDLHEFFPDILPLSGQLGGEWHSGLLILRGEAAFTAYMPVGRNDSTEITVQHAFELQYGHAIGAGVRLQGAWLPSFSELDVAHSTRGDLYQAAIEPFFVVERKLVFMRVGILMPIDEQLGPAFENAWAFRLATGLRID